MIEGFDIALNRRWNVRRHTTDSRPHAPGHSVSREPHTMRPIAVGIACIIVSLGLVTAPARAAAPCGGDFGTWLEGVEQEAAADGISQRAIQASLAGITFDPNIIARDHAQGVFRQTF